MKIKYKALLAEIMIAIGVLLLMDFSAMKTIDYLIIVFMIITLVFTYLNERRKHA